MVEVEKGLSLLSGAPKSGSPKPLGPHSRHLRGGLESDKWQVVGRSYDAPEIETMCVVLHVDRWYEATW